ncbi:hypothetical protein CLIB1423_02S01046 [[Candida] railenensis]|uniref:2,4-dienoyl-CoA reductase [(3E)-enoyl-CoA-producing] n=1 Tax=[Candida] railenensis TaxID=45579 RepID=A0A9P0VVU3_9ASCO|nr:hypothetical protein CLIB1423_02S01046 [[Candida] railenensis]
MKDNIPNKVVVVSGGANGFCRLQVEGLLMCGAHVSIIGKNEQFTRQIALELQNKYGEDRVLACMGIDLTNFSQAFKAIEATIFQFGRIDMVIGGTASNYLRDYSHISSCGWDKIVEIDSEASINLAVASNEQLSRSMGKFLYLDPTVHGYEVEFASVMTDSSMEKCFDILLSSGVEVLHMKKNSWEEIIHHTISTLYPSESMANRVLAEVMSISKNVMKGGLYRVTTSKEVRLGAAPIESRL